MEAWMMYDCMDEGGVGVWLERWEDGFFKTVFGTFIYLLSLSWYFTICMMILPYSSAFFSLSLLSLGSLLETPLTPWWQMNV
jgi:hypothetical protein